MEFDHLVQHFLNRAPLHGNLSKPELAQSHGFDKWVLLRLQTCWRSYAAAFLSRNMLIFFMNREVIEFCDLVTEKSW